MRVVLICFLFVLFPTISCAQVEVQVKYRPAKNAIEKYIKQELKSTATVELWQKLINNEFILPTPLTIVLGSDDGPLFDSETGKIDIPYFYISEIKDRFRAIQYNKKTGLSELDATMDTLLHTLFHEFAHVLFFMYDLPVTGREEDAADGLATLLLIELFENGQEIVLSAADQFDLMDQEIKNLDEQDFWDEHSLDAQRYYTALCHVYGSSPDQYEDLLQNAGMPEEKAEQCIEEYENLSRSWFALLDPHLRKI